MKNNLYYIICLSVFVIFSSCVNNKKLIEKGQYDNAIDGLVKSLQGKKNKPTRDVRDLELAFNKAQQEDLRVEKLLKDENEASNWEKIYNIHEKIDHRQDKIRALVPLISKDGYEAAFQFVNTLERKKEAKINSIAYYYNTALALIQQSETENDKIKAREAVGYLEKIELLSNNYKDVNYLKSKADKLGTVHYLVKVVNNTFKILPVQLEDDLTRISVNDLNSRWKKFDMRKAEGIQYDYNIIMNLEGLEFSPDREKSRIKEDINKEITEETKKDSKGNVVKDSLGNPVKIKSEIVHTNSIEEITQSKTAILSGKLEWHNMTTKNIERREPMNVEINFENVYARLLKGDIKYLNRQNKELVNRRPAVFPTNEQMTLDAGEKLKLIFKDIIHKFE